MDDYATHLEPLIKAAINTPGDILEMGCGDYSTPLLAEIAHSRGDKLTVHASDLDWMMKYAGIADSLVKVMWEDWEPSGDYGLVFLDSEELTVNRAKRLQQLRTHCKVIVMHDASQAMAGCDLMGILKTFQSFEIYDKHTPWTVTVNC